MAVTKRKTPAAQVIDDALRANPQVATKTLATRLYKEHPSLWPTRDACCTAVRRLRGAQGEKHRRGVPTVAERSKADQEACQRWGALLPESEPVEWQWFDLPEGPQRWLILADLHCPYHDHQALTVALTHAEGNCDGVLVLGDGPDAYQLSWWIRDPRKRRFAQEIEDWCKVLDALKKLAPTVVWKGGNHEERLERYLMQKAPELFDVAEFRWSVFCKLAERKITWVPPSWPIRHHHLSLIHGHEWGNRFSSPVNPARGAFLKAHECVLEAHQHRTSHHVEHTLRERPISCWSLGCLCNLHPEYRPLGHKWNHGFAYLTTGSEWTVTNHRIVNKEVV